MKIQDLRVGNYVWLQKNWDKKIYQIDSGYDIYKLDESDCADVSEIEITEDILLKCENIVKINEFEFCVDEYITLKIEDGDWEDICVDVYMKGIYITCIVYVHELQNLFKSINGNELTLKL